MCKYHSLDNIQYPYLFAFTANLTEEIKQSCIDTGFDGCLSSPLTMTDITDLITNYVDKFVDRYMTNQLQNYDLMF